MSAKSGNQPVPLQRRWVNDIMHFGKKAHVVTSNWKVNVAPALAARAAQQPQISWTAIWMKAIALVAQRRAELRTAYMPYPWAHLYVHPHGHCAVVIERTWRDAPAVFFDVFEQPDKITLADLDEALRSLRLAPVESVAFFRRMMAVARLPVLLRRFLWHQVLYWGSGNLRAQLMGTFAVNPFPTGGLITQTATPISFLFFHGLVDAKGDTEIQIAFDHRVIDGVAVYRLLRDVEATVNRDIVAELAAPPTVSNGVPPREFPISVRIFDAVAKVMIG